MSAACRPYPTKTAATREASGAVPPTTTVAVYSLDLPSLSAIRPRTVYVPGPGRRRTGPAAGALKLDLADVRATRLDPVDLRGLPHAKLGGRRGTMS